MFSERLIWINVVVVLSGNNKNKTFFHDQIDFWSMKFVHGFDWKIKKINQSNNNNNDNPKIMIQRLLMIIDDRNTEKINVNQFSLSWHIYNEWMNVNPKQIVISSFRKHSNSIFIRHLCTFHLSIIIIINITIIHYQLRLLILSSSLK